jgi:PAP2 superfamily
MIDLELSWRQAGVAATGLIVASVALRAARKPRLAAIAVFTQESGLILGLFALWQLAGSLAEVSPDGALARSRWIWHFERVVHLPSETSMQKLILHHPLVVQFFNLYYDSLHFPVLVATLIWLFVRHRDRYRRLRTTLVGLTGACLLVQLIPVAPPRMLPETGLVDTAIKYHQSVYASTAGFDPDQLSAMPSVHVGWAILVAVAVITTLQSRWRWLAVLYPVLTTLAVIVTANHFWLDGIVAGLILVLVLAVQTGTRALHERLRAAGAAPAAGPADGALPEALGRDGSVASRTSH